MFLLCLFLQSVHRCCGCHKSPQWSGGSDRRKGWWFWHESSESIQSSSSTQISLWSPQLVVVYHLTFANNKIIGQKLCSSCNLKEIQVGTWHFHFSPPHFYLPASPRPTGGDEFHSEVHVTPFSHHTVGFFHGYYLFHYGIGVVQVQNAQDLLLHWHKFSINYNRKYCTLMH